MKIENMVPKTRHFGSLDNGEAFMFARQLWMKVREVDRINAVRLDDGSLDQFTAAAVVDTARAKVVIE